MKGEQLRIPNPATARCEQAGRAIAWMRLKLRRRKADDEGARRRCNSKLPRLRVLHTAEGALVGRGTCNPPYARSGGGGARPGVHGETAPVPAPRSRARTATRATFLFTWLADVIRHPVILDAVEDLIGPDILCWTTHWFVKEARSPQYVSWHQDSNYWGHRGRRSRERVARGLVLDGRERMRASPSREPRVAADGARRHLGRGQHAHARSDHRGSRRIAGHRPGARAGRGRALRLPACACVAPQLQRRPAHWNRSPLHPADRTSGSPRMGLGNAGAGAAMGTATSSWSRRRRGISTR